jgi:tetratricopeptide (TPR) repeat protein/O-antigen ligase
VALQVWIFLFIAFFGADEVLLEPRFRVIAQLAFAVPLICWAALRVRRRPDLLDAAIAVGLGAYFVVCLASRDQTGSLASFGLVTVYALLFWVLRESVTAPAVRNRIVVAVATAMAFSLAVNAILLVQEKVRFLSETGLVPELQGHGVFIWETLNAMPILVLVSIPFCLFLPRGVYRNILVTAIAAFGAVVVVVSDGRAGMLGLAVMAILFALLSPVVWRRFKTSQMRIKAAVLGLVGVGFAVGAWSIAGPFMHTMAITGRIGLYRASVEMFADRPVFGNGPSTYSWIRFLYGDEPTRVLGLRLSHDVPLQTLVDGGIVLAIALVIIGLVWLRTAVSWELPASRRMAVGALVGYSIAVLFDDFSFLPAITTMLITLAVLALPEPPTRPRSRPQTPKGRRAISHYSILAVASLALIASVPFVVRTDIARVSAGDARALAVGGMWNQALASFQSAVEAHPENGGYWLGVAKSRAELGDLKGAYEAYERARTVSPGDARAYGGLAALTPDLNERIALLQQAVARTAGDAQYAYRLGIALAARGDKTDAAKAWGRAADLKSSAVGNFAYDAYGIDRDATMAAAIAHTYAAPRPDQNVDPAARWDVELSLRALPRDASPAWRAVDAARNGDISTATDLAQSAVASRSLYAYEALAAVSAFKCDAAAVAAALRIANAIGSTSPSPPAAAVAIRREYVYREASLGAMQPAGIPALLPVDRWPWSVIGERPRCP